MPVHSHEKILLTKIIDHITQRATVEKCSFDKAMDKVKNIPELSTEINHTSYSEGAPLNSYAVGKDVNGKTAVDLIKKVISEKEFMMNHEPNNYIFQITQRTGSEGVWLHIEPYHLGYHSYVPLSIDIFTPDYRGVVFHTKPVIGKKFSKN